MSFRGSKYAVNWYNNFQPFLTDYNDKDCLWC